MTDESLPVVDEQSLATLASTDQDTTIVLVYAPDDCFSCGGEYGVWRRWEVEGRADLRLALSRTPTEAERKRIRLARIKIAARWRGDVSKFTLPRVYVLARGSIRDSAIGAAEQSRLVQRLSGENLRDSVAGK